METRGEWTLARKSLGSNVVRERIGAVQPEHKVGLVRRTTLVPFRRDARAVDDRGPSTTLENMRLDRPMCPQWSTQEPQGCA